MSFSVPGRLVHLDYLSGDDTRTKEEKEEDSPYEGVRDYAFFRVNLGMHRQEYDFLTPLEREFMLKAYEDRMVTNVHRIYSACFAASYNVGRRKGKRAIEPLRKAQSKNQIDPELLESQISIIREIDQKEGTAWVDKVYSSLHMKRPKKGAKEHA